MAAPQEIWAFKMDKGKILPPFPLKGWLSH